MRITRLEKDTPLTSASIYRGFYVVMRGKDYNEDFDENDYDVEKVKQEVIDLLPYELDDSDTVEVYFDEDGDNLDLLINITINFGSGITWGELQEYEDGFNSVLESDIAAICGVDPLYVSSNIETKEEIDYEKLDAMGTEESAN